MVFNKYIFLFSLLFLTGNSDQFIKKCTDIIGNPGKTFPIMVNKDHGFFTDTFRIRILAVGYNNFKIVSRYDIDFFVKMSTSTRCDDHIVAPNLMTKDVDEYQFSFRINWGPTISLDDHSVMLYPPFTKKTFLLEGMRGAFRLPLVFDPEGEASYPYTKAHQIEWTQRLENIDCHKPLCMRIFNSSKEYPFMPGRKCDGTQKPIDRLNRLELKSYGDFEMQHTIYSKMFLAEIHQCQPDAIFAVSVDDRIKVFEINIIGGSDETTHKMKFSRKECGFSEDVSSAYIPRLLDVFIKSEDFVTAWPSRKYIFMLQKHKLENFHIQNEKNYYFEFFEVERMWYVTDMFIRLIDDATKIKYYRKGDKSELIPSLLRHFTF